MAEINRRYKDSVFRILFGDKDKLIEVYNAIFDTEYTVDDSVEITTIEDVVFKTLKNDISFIMDGKFVLLIEHQSSINNNMCLRDFLYSSEIYRRMINPKDLYKEKPIRIPNPKFVVLYNGERYMPPFEQQRLSDLFLVEENDEDYSLQLKLDVYNIGMGTGCELLEKSDTLKQYSMFVDRVKQYSKANKDKEALSEGEMIEIMKSCIKDGILVDFLEKYGTEAIGMMFRELTQEEAQEMSRQDGYELGVEQGKAEGIAEGEASKACEMARAMRADNEPVDKIARYTGLPKEKIQML